MLRFSTFGESHGESLAATLSGLPAGVPIRQEFVNRELWRRQQGYGRGGRMKIESDTARFIAGVHHGKTIGAPVCLLIANRDWKNWESILPVEEGEASLHKAVASPRPGHADLAGCLKYNLPDARYILERASARETTSRVAAGAVAKLLLAELGIEVLSHVLQVGEARLERSANWDELVALSQKDEVLLGCVDADAEAGMKAAVDVALRTKDTIGAVFEVVAHNVPPGLGSHANWDEKLDGRLAQAIMSIQAVKGVEIGEGFANAATPGSRAHDVIGYEAGASGFTQFTRPSNRAGGLEGGITNGQDVVVRGYVKPIATLRQPLPSVDFASRAAVSASYERSDVCVAPAAGVVGEAMTALTLAQSVLEKFGGDSLPELKRNYEGYLAQLRAY